MKSTLRPNNEQNFNFRIFGFFQQVVLKALIHSVGDLIPFISRKIIKNKYLGIFNLIMLYILMSTITTRINIIEFVLTTKPYLFEYYLDKLLVFYVLKKSYYQYTRTYSSLYSSLFLFMCVHNMKDNALFLFSQQIIQSIYSDRLSINSDRYLFLRSIFHFIMWSIFYFKSRCRYTAINTEHEFYFLMVERSVQTSRLLQRFPQVQDPVALP